MTIIVTSNILPHALYDGDLSSTAVGVGVANTAYLVAQPPIYTQATLTSIRARFGTGGTGHYDVGIFDSSGASGAPGALLAHAAATATSLATVTGVVNPALIAGTQALVGGNLILNPGSYWLALWIDNATDTINKQGAGVTNMVIIQSGTTTGPLPLAASSLTGLANANFKPLLIGLFANSWS